MKLNHEIIRADWSDDDGQWHVQVKDLLFGEMFIDKAEVLINGGGVLK